MGGSAEYMREAMASLESTGVGLSQITSEVGVWMKVLGDCGGNCFKGRIRPLWATADCPLARHLVKNPWQTLRRRSVKFAFIAKNQGIGPAGFSRREVRWSMRATITRSLPPMC